MKNTIILCSSLLSLAVSAPTVPCPAAVSEDKEALLTELLCVEDHNKELVLERNAYESLLRSIKGQDGSDCLAMRCINGGELSIELLTAPEQVNFAIEFGNGKKHYVTSSNRAMPLLDFRGIIGPMPNGAFADSCQSNSMSYVRVINDTGQAVTLKSVKLVLHYTDDSYKTIFADTQQRSLPSGNSVSFSRDDLLNNQEFLNAKGGSCSDN